MTKRIKSRGEGFETYDRVNDAFAGVMRFVGDNVECTIARKKAELEQFKQRFNFIASYLPGAIAEAANNAEKEGPLDSVIASAFVLLDGDYDGELGVAEGANPPAPDAQLLKGPALLLFEHLRLAGLRPHLAWERRFSRGNGKRNWTLCVFVEARPGIY